MNARGFFTTDIGRISFVKTAPYGKDGKYRASFSLGKTDSIKDADTYKKQYTNIQAVIFNLSAKQAELLKDGSMIYFKGKIANNEYNGKKYTSIVIEEYTLINIGGLSRDQIADTDVDMPADTDPDPAMPF